jgi:multidrug efflux pump
MILSDISVKRPVFASVISLLLVAFGIISISQLPVQEYPDVDPAIVTIQTSYPGASAAIMDNRVTELIEETTGGIEGIKTISSVSQDGRSDVTIEFELSRDIDDAANDVRDAVSRIVDDLPQDANPPEISKDDGGTSSSVIVPFTSQIMPREEITEYLERNLIDRFGALPGVGRARAFGSKYAMRIWLDRQALTARSLTVADVEAALRAENVELPAGVIQSPLRKFTVRVERGYKSAEDFANLVIARGADGYLVRLGDVAKVELGSNEPYAWQVGRYGERAIVSITRQAKANLLELSNAVRELLKEIKPTLPEGLVFEGGRDEADYVREAISEIYLTLGIVAMVVIGVIYLFLGSIRAALIPSVTVPVCLIATFIVLAAFGLSINLMTLLALLLAIGLVVDDAIVVLENVQRRIEEGEPPLLAAFLGTRQVAFAVLATTAVVLAVFAPVIFVKGSIGPIFTELSVAVAAAVAFSALVALTLSASLCGRMLRPSGKKTGPAQIVNRNFDRLAGVYARFLPKVLAVPRLVGLGLVGIITVTVLIYNVLPRELAPLEDRGATRHAGSSAEGTSFAAMKIKGQQIKDILARHVEKGEVNSFYHRVPGSFGSTLKYNTFYGGTFLTPPGERKKTTAEIVAELNREINAIPGIRGRVTMRQGFSTSGGGAPIEFVIGGANYDQLAKWRDLMMDRIAENPKLIAVDSDYRETSPQLRVQINRERAADLGISVQTISRTLQTLVGSSRVTTFIYEGEERDVILQLGDKDRRLVTDVTNINVRSARTGELVPLSNLVSIEEFAGPGELNRFNRMRAITISASLAPGYTQGEALDYLDTLARETLPAGAQIDYRGESREFKEAISNLMFTFLMAFLIVFLVLAAQFESFVHPFIIILTVPLAVFGGLVGLYLGGSTINAYSQIGIIILMGLAAKNGILIVEFANQLRDAGMHIREALLEAVRVRFRPILMTNIATALGVVPLVIASGPGAAGRQTIGLVIFFGVICATFFTLFVIPVFYDLLAHYTRPPRETEERLAAYEQGLAGGHRLSGRPGAAE